MRPFLHLTDIKSKKRNPRSDGKFLWKILTIFYRNFDGK